MITERARIAAAALHEARAANRPLTQFPSGSRPASRRDAIAIQDAVVELSGEPVVAWKAGPAAAGFPETAAPITRSRLLQSPARMPNALRLKGVEVEIAFRLGRDLSAGPQGVTRAEVIASIATVMPAVEVVETRYNAWPVPDRLLALADSQSNEALVIGPESEFVDDIVMSGITGTLDLGGVIIPADRGFPGGDPIGLVAWLASHVRCRSPGIAGRGLKAGDVITTGSWNGVDFAGDNMTATAAFPELGTVTVVFG